MIHDSDAEADNTDYGLRLGAYGWQHQHWLRVFYPEDLPEDWQLGFYGNEFMAVLVPAQYWFEEYDIGQWCEDVSPRFRFYLEYTSSVDVSEFAQKCREFGSLLAGIISKVDLDYDLPCSVYVIPDTDQSVKLLKSANELGPDLALITLGESDLRQQRIWLENLHLQSSDLATVILIDDYLAIERLQSFKTLIELMGF